MLGRPVVSQLIKDDFKVSVLVRDPSKSKISVPPQAKIIQGDLQEINTIKKAVKGVDAVYINLSTRNHKASFKTELDGTRNIVQALDISKNLSPSYSHGNRRTRLKVKKST